jgi:hypothetical protein
LHRRCPNLGRSPSGSLTSAQASRLPVGGMMDQQPAPLPSGHGGLPMRPMTVLCVVLLCGWFGSVAARAQPVPPRPEIWFSPLQDSLNPSGHGLVFNVHDFPAMVASTNEWQQALSHTSVLRLNAMGLAEAYPDLPPVIAMVNRIGRPIVAGGSFVHTNGACQVRIEGVSNDTGYEHEIVHALHRWKLAGGRLDYVIMDSPLLFGHWVTEKQCHFSIEDTARSAADTMLMIKKDYPDIKVVDAEGPAWVPLSTWLPALEEFWKAFQADSGTRVSYLSMDLSWRDAFHTGYNLIDTARQTALYVRTRGVKAGVFINADDRWVEHLGQVVPGETLTDHMWMQENREHLRAIHDAKLPLDFIMIASWMKFPRRNLPENDPDAYASLVNFAWELWSH